jgi:large subunit ribosomal protein L29
MPRAIAEFRDLGDEELLERLESSKEELFNLRFQLATGQLDNPMRIKNVRHDVARILGILRQRNVEAQIDETTPERAASEPATPAETGDETDRGDEA